MALMAEGILALAHSLTIRAGGRHQFENPSGRFVQRPPKLT
jgi:hypothetical protein